MYPARPRRIVVVAACCLIAGCAAAVPVAPAAPAALGAPAGMDAPASISANPVSTDPGPESFPTTAVSTSPADPTTAPAAAHTTKRPVSTAPRPSATRPSTTSSALPAPTHAGPATVTTGLALLSALPVKGRAPKTGYRRAEFGDAWTDDNNVAGGHNGCDTRNDILRRDLTNLVIKPGSHGCAVASGILHDPYTATTIVFTRGVSTSNRVQIDHIVALSDAWQTGAQQLTVTQRIDLANDPRNLQAVDGPTNEAKSDSDAASWLPPNKSYRCTFVTRQIQVKAVYHLWVTAAEKAAMQQQLTHCQNDAGASTGSSLASRSAIATPRATTTAGTPPPRPRTTSAAPTPTADVSYKNCTAVKAAGKAPLLAGQPGYRSALDGDHDGVACES